MAETSGGPRRLEDGRILAQLHGTGPDGEMADGLVPIGPDHPLWKTWDDWLRQRGQ